MDFVRSIFDLSFNTFITSTLVKVLYVASLVVIALGFLGTLGTALVTMFRGDFVPGLGMLCAAPFILAVLVVLARLYTELIIVLFKIAENTSELAGRKRNI